MSFLISAFCSLGERFEAGMMVPSLLYRARERLAILRSVTSASDSELLSHSEHCL